MWRTRIFIATVLLRVGRCVLELAPRIAPPLVSALLLSVPSKAQDPPVDERWRIVVERDTLAIGPLDDLRLFAGLRAAKNAEVRRCVWELHMRAREVSLLRSANERYEKGAQESRELIGDLNAALVQCVDAKAKAERRAKRRSPFIWGLSGIAIGVVGTMILLR